MMSFTLSALALPGGSAVAQSPLGRYADFVTAIVSVGVILAAFASHLGIIGVPDPYIDSIALIAVGILFGTARGVAAGGSAQNVELAELVKLLSELTMAAHKRLDQIDAPPAVLDVHSGLAVGKPDPE